MPAQHRLRFIIPVSRPLLCGLLASALCIGAPLSSAQDITDEPAATEAATSAPSTAEVARRAAVRKNRDEQRALREVLFKHTGLCDQKPAQYCPQNNYAACAEQLRQTCASIKLQMQMCEAQTQTYCSQHRGAAKCVEAMKGQCDSGKQSLDQILAKYPDLSPTQKSQLKQIAARLEKNTDQSVFGSLASRFLDLLGFAI